MLIVLVLCLAAIAVYFLISAIKNAKEVDKKADLVLDVVFCIGYLTTGVLLAVLQKNFTIIDDVVVGLFSLSAVRHYFTDKTKYKPVLIMSGILLIWCILSIIYKVQ